MKTVAIITARGGSKRIPHKNIKNFLGKPIISYSIRAALESGLFSNVMVSTDDDQIAEVALKCGANVPFKRSKETSNDYATTNDVLLEVLSDLKKTGNTYDFACCLYPTAVFITAEQLKTAYEMLVEGKADMVFPCAEYSTPIQRSFKKKPDGTMFFAFPEFANERSQDLELHYYDTGQFYFFKVDGFLKRKTLLSNQSKGLLVKASEVQDIDVQNDWELAEQKFRLLRHQS